MLRLKWPGLALMASALTVTIPLVAATVPSANTNSKSNKKTTKTAVMRTAWSPETISGRIFIVSPVDKLVVVETPNKVPFDVRVNSKTQIKFGDKTVTLNDLAQDTNKTVSIKFIPERRGDIARSIHLNG